MRKVSKLEIEDRKQKAQDKKERKERLKRELSTPAPNGINELKDRVEKLEEWLDRKSVV